MEQDRCIQDDFALFLTLWNTTQNYKTPGIHYRIAIWLQKCWEHGQKRLLLQAFRASGKSTIAGLFSAWLLCRDPDLRILVLSAESHLAEKMVRTVRKVIETHPMARAIRPRNPDQWASDSFTVERSRVSRDPSVLARGLYANITGTRADIIICDDVEVPNTCDTVDKREKLRDRLAENDFILTPGGTILYIGTPHTYYSLYAKKPREEIGEREIFLANHKRLTIPIQDKYGKSVWPERYNDSDISDMRSRAGVMKFASQMMLEPVNIHESRLDISLLRRYGEHLTSHEAQKMLTLKIGTRKIVSASAWWDPAFGAVNGDSSVLAVAFTDEAGDLWLHRMEYIKVKIGEDEDEATLQCRQVVIIAKELFLPSITIETNGIGKFLPAILRKELAIARVPCAVVEQSSRKAKAERILEAFDVALAARALYVHESVYKTRFITEMQEWSPSGCGPDDGLDAAAGAISLEPVRVQKTYQGSAKIWSGSGNGHTAITDFDV